jgi:hypothetical protein
MGCNQARVEYNGEIDFDNSVPFSDLVGPAQNEFRSSIKLYMEDGNTTNVCRHEVG